MYQPNLFCITFSHVKHFIPRSNFWNYQISVSMATIVYFNFASIGLYMTSLFVCLFIYLFICKQDISKSFGQIMTKLGGWVGLVMRTSWLDFGSGPDGDPAYQWDTKHKLFSLAEVCALPSALLVAIQLYRWTLQNTNRLLGTWKNLLLCSTWKHIHAI